MILQKYLSKSSDNGIKTHSFRLIKVNRDCAQMLDRGSVQIRYYKCENCDHYFWISVARYEDRVFLKSKNFKLKIYKNRADYIEFFGVTKKSLTCDETLMQKALK